ncbi:MAG: ATP-binding protein, partial [Proteobacteria bacterium]
MNYYRGRSLSLLGLRAIEVFIECAQSRRLPFIQIIGASNAAANEQRERVMAALESTGFKLPGRRLTLRYTPDMHGFPLENFDCAIALAILGSAKAFPTEKFGPIHAIGSLSLNGNLSFSANGSVNSGAFRAWLEENPGATVFVPWEISAALGANAKGGGFRDLTSILAHLRRGETHGPRRFDGLDFGAEVADQAEPVALDVSAAEYRLALISAAGGHHLLVVDGEEEQGDRLSRAVRALLPRPQESGGRMGSAEPAPLRMVSEAQAGRLFRFDRKHGSWGELSFSHGGVLHLKGFRHESPALIPLWEAMREGVLRYTQGGLSIAHAAELITVAETAPCECGGSVRRKSACVCRPAMKERRLRAVASAPFDLRCFSKAEGARSVVIKVPNIAEIRGQMMNRQGKINGKLTLSESLRVKAWSWEATEWLRVGDRKLGTAEALARVALTISDLRKGKEVSRED